MNAKDAPPEQIRWGVQRDGEKRSGRSPAASHMDRGAEESAEVALQQTLEGLAVAGLVAGHLVHGVVDGVQIEGLRLLASSNLPAVAPFSASTRICRFFLVESVTTSPSSSANLAACSASS